MPAEGYVFEKWSDGNTQQVREVTVSSDVSLSAVFKKIEVKKTVVDTNKKASAKAKISQISDINKAKMILERIVEQGDDTVINLINEL